jgi:hypothetical protein
MGRWGNESIRAYKTCGWKGIVATLDAARGSYDVMLKDSRLRKGIDEGEEHAGGKDSTRYRMWRGEVMLSCGSLREAIEAGEEDSWVARTRRDIRRDVVKS